MDIDSGPSGWIDVEVGGELIISSPLAAGATFSLDFDIEHQPKP